LRTVRAVRFRVLALRLRALGSLLLALERRRIAHPKLRTTPIFQVGLQQGFATGEMVLSNQFALQKILNCPCKDRDALLTFYELSDR
jgi:hypothetical protein